MSDSEHESKARIIFEPLSLSHLKKQDLLIGLVCIRRNPPAPILAAKPGFRMLLQVLNRIFGVHFSRSGVDGHLLFSSSVCDRSGTIFDYGACCSKNHFAAAVGTDGSMQHCLGGCHINGMSCVVVTF